MSWPIEFDQVLSRLQKVRGTERQGYACCPAHHDRHQSLSWAVRNGRLVLNCHAPHGCTIVDIMGSLGLEMGYLFADHYYDCVRQRRRPVPIQDVYPYCDAGGVLRYEVVRLQPKDFRQRRPNPDYQPAIHNPDQEYIWSIAGQELFPYRYPELIRELEKQPKAPVAIVEGEKDVDALRDLGIIATCNQGGAGKWTLASGKVVHRLCGRRVVVVADDDPFPSRPADQVRAGRRHARQVCESLLGLAEKIKLVQFTDRGQHEDTSDFLATLAGTKADKARQFWQTVSTFPEWTKSDNTEVAERAAPVNLVSPVQLFTGQVAEVVERIRAKSPGPVRGRAEAYGLVSLHYNALVQASALDEAKFLSALAGLVAAAQVAGLDLTGGK